MILLIDNYDSFVHNLARYLRRLGADTLVLRNDELDAERARQLAPAAVVLSPGPCTPDEAGCSLQLVRQLHREVPMLGVCLGHQSIAQAMGARVDRAERPWHGRRCVIRHDASRLFAGVPSPFAVGRYHSLVVPEDTLPDCLRATAWTEQGNTVMAVEHRELPLFGVQFHPESILTEFGYKILSNFLSIAGVAHSNYSDALLAAEMPLPAQQRPLPTRPVTF